LEKLPCPTEIVVVDDASEDGTADAAELAARSLQVPLHVIRRAGRRSLSGSVIDGAFAAAHDTIVVLDADYSHDPALLPELVRGVRERGLDVCVGSRYADGGEISSWPWSRRLLSRLGTFFARRLAGVSDPLSGYFACRRELLTGGGARLRPRGYKVLLEVLGRSPGLHAAEVPAVFRDRALGESKLGMRQLLEFLVQIASLAAGRVAGCLRRQGRRSAMARRLLVPTVVVAAGLAALLFFPRSRPSSAAGEGAPLLVIYSEPNFTGRSLEVTGSLADLPAADALDEEGFDWNDSIRSLRVVRGTWRIHQHGRLSTELDDTPLEALDLSNRRLVPGWSCLLSASSQGPLEVASPEAGGLGLDASSIELVSRSNLPDWALP
jgi:dolichol-phosphate mannosyltransferase